MNRHMDRRPNTHAADDSGSSSTIYLVDQWDSHEVSIELLRHIDLSYRGFSMTSSKPKFSLQLSRFRLIDKNLVDNPPSIPYEMIL